MTDSSLSPGLDRVTVVSFANTAASTAGQMELIARRCNLTIIQPDSWPWYAGEPPVEVPGVRTLSLPTLFAGHHHFHVYRRLRSSIRDSVPDLLHIDQEPWTVSTAQAVLAGTRIPCPIVGFTWQNLLKRYPPPFRWIETWVHRRVTMMIAGNAEAADVLRRRGYRGLVRVIPQYGVDLNLFKPGPSMKEEFGVPVDAFILGFVGRIVAAKGLETAVRAVSRVPGVHLALAGVGSDEEELRRLATAEGIGDRLHFLGGFPSRRVSRVMNSFDALILPSLTTPGWKEQFGRVLIEAMAAEVPVLGSSSGEIPNVVGEAGKIFKEGNVDDCAKALRELLDPDQRLELVRLGAARVQAHFSQERIAARFWEAWREARDAWCLGDFSPRPGR